MGSPFTAQLLQFLLTDTPLHPWWWQFPKTEKNSSSEAAAAFCGDLIKKTAKRMKPELLSLLPCLSWEYFTIPTDS